MTPFAVLGLQGAAHKLLVLGQSPSALVTSRWALPRLKPIPFSTQVPRGLHLSLSAIHAFSRAPEMPCGVPSPRLGHLSENR